MKPMPRHIQAMIEAKTGLDLGSSLSRSARPLPCPKCGTWTLAGLEGDVTLISVRLDPTPLNPFGEAAAVMRNHQTFNVGRTRDGKLEIIHRDSFRMGGHPAGAGKENVHAEHECQWSWQAEFITADRLPRRPQSVAVNTSAAPPF